MKSDWRIGTEPIRILEMKTSHRNKNKQYNSIAFKNRTWEFTQNVAQKEKKMYMKKQLIGMKGILSLSSKLLLRGSEQKNRTNGQQIFFICQNLEKGKSPQNTKQTPKY